MDQRDYVSKRTCVSLVLSVAFFTLICGFLLGKFVSDRHHHIRMLNLEQSRNANALQLKNQLSVPALKFVENDHRTTHDEQNRKLWQEFIACMQHQTLPYNTERLDTFVNHFIDQQFREMSSCMRKLELYLNQLTPE
ncbi:uncharacterized protein LOC134835199 [Culicoides brevitarsis]|uniref:uncharacterized protein LOC134835199 n=1 Tax=Culicoides brevitarsis TaxID=469753 RepID=UPI00307B158B